MTQPLAILWAKTHKQDKRVHLLRYHLVDVATVAVRMWHDALAPSERGSLAHALGLAEDRAGALVAYWASLHDLGKATPAFQYCSPQRRDLLRQAGLRQGLQWSTKAPGHGEMSAALLEPALQADGLPVPLAKRLARVLGGHHGAWPTPLKLQSLHLTSEQLGDKAWADARQTLLQELRDALAPPVVPISQLDTPVENALLTLLGGLVSVADWVGSSEDFFAFEDRWMPLPEYLPRADAQARRALHDLGWLERQPLREPLDFLQVFGWRPRLLQREVVNASGLEEPGLVILEAPTGIGKTEAALWIADRWTERMEQAGLYVAMPTTATSNQMFGRVKKYLQSRYPANWVNLQLVHGQALWSDQLRELRLDSIDDDQAARVAAMGWFLPRKRSLLAPFGVGTVDQAFLSVLQTRHFFVRLFGLSHKTVIFDEVHAYDAYMSMLFHRLLEWLRQIGTSVIVLSATLPAQTRAELVKAYLGCSDLPMLPDTYPLLTHATLDGRISATTLSPPPSQSVQLEWIDRDPAHIDAALQARLAGGGCAAVVCNTVRRAQEVYRILHQAHPDWEVRLFHARYPFVWRDEIEQWVLGRFGNSEEGRRPRAVLVATQVIEQSLDLDFDYMVSDLAPVDLLLQRMGRLHRHVRSERPAPTRQPALAIACPEARDGVPEWGSDGHVYEPFVLWMTLRVLRPLTRVETPRDTVALIEAVYGENARRPADDPALEQMRKHMLSEHQKSEFNAAGRLVRGPGAEDLITSGNLGLEEDDPGVHQTLRALTREADPGLALVCLHRTPSGLALDPEGSVTLDPTVAVSVELVRALQQRSINVTHPAVMAYFLKQEPPAGWKEQAALRYSRLAEFESGVCVLPGTHYRLALSRELGLEIQRKEEQ